MVKSNALVRKNEYDAENYSPKIVRQNQIFNELINER